MPRHGSSLLSHLSEASLLLLAVGPAVAIGGVHHPVQLAATLLSVLCLILVWLYRRPDGRGLHLPLFGVALLMLSGFTLLQLVPLPMGILRVLAPATAEVLRVSLGEAGAGGAHPISLDPGATLWEALKMACYSLAFIAAHNFYYRSARHRRLMVALVLVGSVLTFLGLTGAVVAPGKPLMLYTPEAGYAPGMITTSFVNPNNGAAFLVLCVLAALGLAIDSKEPQRKVMLTGISVLLGAGVALSLSRGGILALGLGMGIFALLGFWRRRKINLGQVAIFLPSAAALVLLVAGWLAYDQLARELASIAPSLEGGFSKVAQWPYGVAMLLANPWVGVGRGAFQTSFPRYQQGDIFHGTYEYMENQFIQLPAEVGLVVGGGFMVMAALAWVAWFRSGCDSGKRLATAAAILALAAHNLVDFSFEIIGVGLPLCLLAGGLSAAGRRRKATRTTTAVCLLAGGVTAVLVLATAVIYPVDARDDDRALSALARSGVSLGRYLEVANQVSRRRPADYMPHLTSAHQAKLAGDPRTLAMLNRSLFLFPRSPKIHLEVARSLIKFGVGRHQIMLAYRLAMENGASFPPVLKEALPLCKTAADLANLLPDRVKIHTRAIFLLNLARRWELARTLANGSIRRWPANPELCVRRTQVMLNQQDPQGLGAARHCKELSPSVTTYQVLALALAAAGAVDEQLAVLREGSQLFSGAVVLTRALVSVHMARGEFAAAQEVAELILELAEDRQERAMAHKLMARVHQAQGHIHSAAYHLKQASEIW